MADSLHALPADALSESFRVNFRRILERMSDTPSGSSCADLEWILGTVVAAYGKARMSREDGAYCQTGQDDVIPDDFPVSLTPTAVMLTIDRLLQAAELNTFELALWQHVGRYEEANGSSNVHYPAQGA